MIVGLQSTKLTITQQQKEISVSLKSQESSQSGNHAEDDDDNYKGEPKTRSEHMHHRQ